mmetsp:Transcript_31575/g.89664  ORF Transcript_31575/g.89664 Transcript_31575/m.89664 type:complete len:169 (-) Transcript_31575:229-735(-)
MDTRARLLALFLLAGASVCVSSRALGDHENVLVLPHLTSLPMKGYHGMYDIVVLGIHHKVQIYYYMLPDQKQFYFKTSGSGVDIPWCGPAGFDLQPIGDGTFEILQVDPDPHCGEEAQKEHPVKNLKRIWDPVNNVLKQSMTVYTAWPIGWKDVAADCMSCDTPDCQM